MTTTAVENICWIFGAIEKEMSEEFLMLMLQFYLFYFVIENPQPI